jgi:putative ABC transport system permease protein
MDIIVTTNTGAPPTLAGNLSRIEGVHWTNDTPDEEWRPGVSVAELTGAKFEIWDNEETSLLVAVNSSTYPLAIEQDLIEPDPNVTDIVGLFDQLGGTGDNKCIISDRLADELQVKVGQKTKLEISAHGNSTEFTIIGIVHNDLIGYPSGGYFCIIDLEKYYDFGFDDDVHIFYVKLRNQHWNGTVVDQDKVAQKILDLYGDEYNLSIIKTKDIVEEWKVNVGETTQFMATLSSSSIIIALLCLATTMIRIVQERQREIGLLRSVGYYRSEIIKLLLGESLLLAVLGLTVGIINGYILAASYLPHFKEIGFTPYEVEFVFPALQTITVAILGLIVAVAGTAFPAYKALRMSPAQAVRYTG